MFSSQKLALLYRSQASVALLPSRAFHKSQIVWSTDDYQYLQRSKMPTMHFQKSLLRLPIPELEKTCERYLRCQKVVLSPSEYKMTEGFVSEFKGKNGPDLQAKLKAQDKANKHTSYISEPWFDMYLSDRVPVVLNYNPFLGFLPEDREGYADPIIRATNILVSSMRFMHTLRDSILEPEVYHLNPAKSDTQQFRNIVRWIPEAFSSYGAYAYKAFPLDMSQFGNLFNSTRIPEIGKDRLLSDPAAKHMLMMRNGHFYVFDIFDENGNILTPDHVHACIAYIHKDQTPAPEHPVGILTSENRDTWATLRAELVAAGNEEMLQLIDTAAFNIVFDDHHVGTEPEKLYRTFLYGNGANRWFDKSFSLIFTADGQVALNFEHSWGDGVAVMRYFNEVAKDAVEKSRIHPDSRPANIDASQYVRRLDFRLTPSLEAGIQKALKSYEASTSALGINTLESFAFGKKFCKKHKVSPDAMMQLGFQVAYYLQNGIAVPTYESCSTSAFKHGRTETIRPATLETLAFSKAVGAAQSLSKAELKDLIMKCSTVHGNLTKEAAMGQGFDRHLFGMRKIAESAGGQMPSIYLDEAYAKNNHIILSTSTLPSTLLSFGGFAPVVRDGFGVGYQIQDDRLGIVLSSYPPHRDGKGFIECADKAYKVIYDVLAES